MKFDFEYIENAIHEYVTLSNQTDDIVADLNNILQTLEKNSFWEGEASDYYCKSFKEFLKNAEEISLSMKNVHIFLEQICKNNKQMEALMTSRVMKG